MHVYLSACLLLVIACSTRRPVTLSLLLLLSFNFQGKSSLMVALYRLVEISGLGSGVIRLDGVDTSTLGLDFLRESMAIISQVRAGAG